MVTRVLLCFLEPGAPAVRMTPEGAALLVGVSVEELLERWHPDDGLDTLPPDWRRRAEKRRKTARNVIDDSVGINGVLMYWAILTWGARSDFNESAGQQWAVIDDET